ncbi:MAG: N-acetylglucosamine-6-phosphate deacetylase [Clostridia bacterium]|nr:N-acetylglucosamine-6-phosphate deacetylase [Clostridia bacterium]
MILYGGQVFRTEERAFAPMDLWIEGGKIRGVGAPGAFDKNDSERMDVTGYWIIPGLIDVHTHGRVGHDFVNATSEKVGEMLADYARHGVTSVMATVETAPFEKMMEMVDLLNLYEPKANEAGIPGVHLEGRYMNPEKRGAHAKDLLAPPVADELDAKPLGECKRLHISVALEMDKDGSFAQKARSMGATLGLGHTTATYAEAKEAEARGIVSYTHLYNCMPPLHHRDGGAVCAAFEGDRIVELISDGVHISPEMIRLAYRAKGVDGISLISDSIAAAGYADGDYHVGGLPITVKDGIARTKENGALAGSTLALDQAVNRFAEFCGIPLTEAVVAATKTPAKQIGAYDEIGSIDEGKSADLILMRSSDRIVPEKIMLRGSWLSL